MAKLSFKKKALCIRKLDLNLRNKPVKCYSWSIALCGTGTGHCGASMRNMSKVLKFGSGDGWRRSAGPIV
jgi:hypothetical protein